MNALLLGFFLNHRQSLIATKVREDSMEMEGGEEKHPESVTTSHSGSTQVASLGEAQSCDRRAKSA